MKRLSILLILMLIYAAAIYFAITQNLVYIENLEPYEYVIYGGISVTPILIGIFIVVLFNRKKDKKIAWLKNRLEQWTNLSVHVNKAGDEVFSELPIGIIIYDDQNDIKWVNRYSKKIFNKYIY